MSFGIQPLKSVVLGILTVPDRTNFPSPRRPAEIRVLRPGGWRPGTILGTLDVGPSQQHFARLAGEELRSFRGVTELAHFG